MKCFFIIMILFFSCSFIYSQGFEFSEYVDLDTDTLVTAAVEQAIAYNSPYIEVVIVAKDSGTNPTLPTWFFPAMNDLPSFFSDGTFGQFEYDNVVLTAGQNQAFIFQEVYRDTFPGGC